MRWVAVCAVLVGCASAKHVTIQAPPASLTQAQRIDAFQYYRMGGEGMDMTTSCSNRGCTTRTRRVIILADGTEVRHAEDLIPLLPENTIAGYSARSLARHESRGRAWRWIALGGLVGGLGVAMIAERMDQHDVGVGATAVGISIGVIGLLGSLKNYLEAKSETDSVFDHYNQGLAQRFGVCVWGYQLVPCEGYAPAAQAQGQVPPMRR